MACPANLIMMVYTYLLKSTKDNSFYTGISKDPEKRLKAHNTGKVNSTKFRKPFILVHKKKHNDYSSARKHEKWLKKKNNKYKNKLAG